MDDANSGNAQPDEQPNVETPSVAEEVSWADDGGAVAEATEVVAETPVAASAADVTEVVAAAEMPGAAEPTEVIAAEATTGYPSETATEFDAGASPTTVESAAPTTPAADAGSGAAGAAGAAGATAGWAAAAPPPYAAAPPPPPPPGYQAGAPAAQAGYQAAPPPAYPAAPNAAAGGAYGTVTPYQARPQTSNKAVVAMVLAILSFVVCPVILAIAALIVGGQAKSEIASSNGWLTGEGLVTGAKILAWVNIALSVLAVIFMFIFFAALGNSLNDLQVNIDPSTGGLGT